MALFRTVKKCSKIGPDLFRRFNKYSVSDILSAEYNNKLTCIGSNCFHTTNLLYKRRKTAEERKSSRIIEYSPKPKSELVDLWKGITVAELAQVLNRDVRYVRDLFLGKIGNANTVIDDVVKLREAISRSGKRMRLISKPQEFDPLEKEEDVFPRPPPDKSQLKPRPPVVTVMGHVDHGKTTLLDALRNSRVVDQEFGGITQHIGAFSVILSSGAKITFLDTPGHAAFTSMRERGANVTDIVVLVVAADDGVMEQTLESIRMAKQANVSILVAINKIDSPNADIERTQSMLIQAGIQVEGLGGDVQCVPISALKRQNLDQLMEALVLQADLLQVAGDPCGPAEAIVIESKVHPHRGRLCTVIVQRGTLKKGDILVAGTALCKIRLMKDAEGNTLHQVEPGNPAEVEGWRDLPSAGEQILQVDSERKARAVIRTRQNKEMISKQEKDAAVISEKQEQHNRVYKEKLGQKRRMGRFKLKEKGPRQKEIKEDDTGIPSLDFIIKADVDGTLEAILNTLDTYNCDKCNLDLVHYGVGNISETDIELAKTFNGIIYAFNVNCTKQIEELAIESNIVIKHHNVIYKLIDDIKSEINLRLPNNEVEVVIGEATVLQQFEISEGRKKVPIAGCRCVKGSLKRAARYRLMRNQQVIYDGTLDSMRHLKNEVDSIQKDLECGLQLSDKSIAFQNGDILVCYEKTTVPQVTEWDPGF